MIVVKTEPLTGGREVSWPITRTLCRLFSSRKGYIQAKKTADLYVPKIVVEP